MVRQHFSARNIVIIVFIVISLGSAVFIYASTINYLHFFPALDNIKASVGSVYYNPAAPGLPLLRTNVTVGNPSDYQGFTLVTAIVRVEFTNGTFNLFNNLPLEGQQTTTLPIGPNNSVSEAIVMVINSENATALDSLIRNSPGSVTAHILFTAEIGTFLDPVVGNSQVNQPADLPLTV